MLNWINRYYEHEFPDLLAPGKVWMLYGPRRTGKTALIKKFTQIYEGKSYVCTGEDRDIREVLCAGSARVLRSAFSGYDLLVIDEAQYVPGIGQCLKLLVDCLPEIRVIASGSSSFELSGTVGAPLTGRQRVAHLTPIAVMELASRISGMEIRTRLEEFMIYGMYPEVLTSSNYSEQREYLVTLRDSYLFKDILALENIRNASKLSGLLKLLAFQIGHEVSINELANNLDLAKKTVERYLDLLAKMFVITRVSGFSRNLHKEVVKSARYYFLDNGIRNAVINNFNPLDTRNDVGQLWENFLFAERAKFRGYKRLYANAYFWRTYDRQEIDLVEERGGKLYGYEFKWKPRKLKPPRLWTNTYPKAEFLVIDRDNFLEFVK